MKRIARGAIPRSYRIALLPQTFAARSIIGAILKATQPDRTGATLLGKSGLALSLAAVPACGVMLPASPGRYLAKTAAMADRDLPMPKLRQ